MHTSKQLEEFYFDLVDPLKKGIKKLDPYNLNCGDCNIDRVIEGGFKVCPNCGAMDLGDPEHEVLPWVAPIAMYKRRLYCIEKLKLYAGYKLSRNSTYINLVKKLKNNKIDNIIDLKQNLKILKMKKFYKYVYNLFFDIKNIRLINLSSQDIDFLSQKFIEAESLFKLSETHKRKNFFNYNSCLYLLMKKYGFKGFNNIILPLNHLQISKTLRILIN